MNRPLLLASLRVLSSSCFGSKAEAPDVDLLIDGALVEELEGANGDLRDLARLVARRLIEPVPAA